MRKLFWWLLLLCLCAIAGLVQSRWRRGIRAEREELRSRPATLEEREEGWARITVGNPGGAEPVEIEPWPAGPDGTPLPAGDTPPSSPTPPADPDAPPPGYVPSDFLYTVPRGRVLSKICEDFYGSGKPPIPERVAEYNGMADPDALREGQVLKLPPREVLFPEER